VHRLPDDLHAAEAAAEFKRFVEDYPDVEPAERARRILAEIAPGALPPPPPPAGSPASPAPTLPPKQEETSK
jgi:hypothetical protein